MALPQQDKKLKPDAIRTDSSTEDQKSYKTISAVPTKAVEEEKEKGTYQKNLIWKTQSEDKLGRKARRDQQRDGRR